MNHIIEMPKLGLTMETGTIVAWFKKVGDQVVKGEIIFELETDKITNTVESPVDGIIVEILSEEGEDVRVHENVCTIETDEVT